MRIGPQRRRQQQCDTRRGRAGVWRSCRRILARASFGLLALAVAVAAPASAQDRSVQDRLDRLERDLSMLQRQVYHGIAGGGAAPADNGDAVNIEIRMERLETEMRDLTGRVEDQTNQVQQLRQRLEQVNSDMEVRAGEAAAGRQSQPPAPARPGGGGIAGIAPGGERPRLAPAEPDARSLTPPANPALPGTPVPPPANPNFGTLTPPGQPRPPPETASAEPTAIAGTLPSGSASEQYNYAFGLLKQADYAGAEGALREFVRQHPGEALAGNAQYWLGETYYARGKYPEAATAFAEGYKRYPRGAKAPDDLLKLGMALARANQRQNACLALNQLDHDFPNPGGAIKERAVAEKKRLGC